MPLGVVLLDGRHARAHFAFSFVAGAAAMDRPVTLLATGAGLRALCRDWSAMPDAAADRLLIARGLAGIDTLRDAAISLGVRLLACEAGLRGEAIAPEELLDEVQVSGIASFLADLRTAQLISF